MAIKHRQLSDQLREAIECSDLTRYRISQETGISEATLSRFATGRGGLSMAAMDKIGELLNLEIVVAPPKKRKK